LFKGASNLEAEIYTTYTDLLLYTPHGQSALRFGIALAANLSTKNFQITQSAMYLDEVNVSCILR